MPDNLFPEEYDNDEEYLDDEENEGTDEENTEEDEDAGYKPSIFLILTQATLLRFMMEN